MLRALDADQTLFTQRTDLVARAAVYLEVGNMTAAPEGEIMDTAMESRTGEMNIMDASGHQQLKWNTGNPNEVAQAQATFDRLIRQGYAAFGSDTKVDAKHGIATFDPAMEEVVMVPRIVGG